MNFDDENIHQIALRQWITEGLKIPEVAQLNGDAGYIFNNMIAKYTLASDYYAVSQSAYLELKRNNVDMDKTYYRRNFYGKDKLFMYEHPVPATVVRAELLKRDLAEVNIREVLKLSGNVTLILRSENEALRDAKLNAKMPANWTFGKDPYSRYNEVGITLSNQKLKVKGAIVR